MDDEEQIQEGENVDSKSTKIQDGIDDGSFEEGNNNVDLSLEPHHIEDNSSGYKIFVGNRIKEIVSDVDQEL